MVNVKVLGRVKGEKRQLIDDVPEYLFKDKKVVLTSMAIAGHTCHSNDHPYPEQRAGICKDAFQFLFHTAKLEMRKKKEVCKPSQFAHLFYIGYLSVVMV